MHMRMYIICIVIMKLIKHIKLVVIDVIGTMF